MVWLADNADLIAGYAALHAWYGVPPLVVSLAVAVPAGWLVNRAGRARSTLLALIGALYAIPSLPLLIMLPSLLGTRILDPINLEVALSLYAVALMIQYCADAFASLDVALLDSADAMGFDRLRRFRDVELPKAGPVILAGLRVVSVGTIALVTVGSLIGVPSLGVLFVEGYQRAYPLEIIVGVVGTMLIAAVFDAALVAAGRALMPWTRGRGAARRAGRYRTGGAA